VDGGRRNIGRIWTNVVAAPHIRRHTDTSAPAAVTFTIWRFGMLVGTVLQGRYRIVRAIKRGGMGAVYEAEDTKFKCRVAIKQTIADTPRLRAALEREALLLARLRHAHLPRVSDHFNDETGHYLVMDFIDGKDLATLIEEGGAPPDCALRWAHQLLDVVEYLHLHRDGEKTKAVIHCDIKPLNLKPDVRGDIVLLDFGLASGLPTELVESHLQTVPGATAAYAPIEQQMRDGNDEPEPRWDIYAIGATLYHVLVGEVPVNAGKRSFHRSNGYRDPFVPAHEKKPETVSVTLSKVLSKALAFNADDRYATIGEFRAALAAAVSSLPAPAVMVSPSSPAIVVPQLLPSFTNSIGMEFVLVPAGSFVMGSSDDDMREVLADAKRYREDANLEWFTREQPQHEVRIAEPFYLGKYEVTQGEWAAVMGSNPSYFKGDDRLPVEMVSWNDCQEFVTRLNARNDGYVYGLPSEAEWEYACRAGTRTPFSFGETITAEQVNYDGNFPYGNAPKGKYRGKTTRVGSFPPNAWGLHDMHGNVLEWCQDGWHDDYNGAPTDARVREQGSDNLRVLRGGSCSQFARDCRSANRFCYAPSVRGSFIGVRVAVRLATNW
jgi:formylglycine-generating enzyme required for sulfatase activity/tRNA A-37 threonylcarbamoyl transferase component Bud32